ncbi:preprotein translocase subunit SecE [Candidatus Shapirobacteria bacterium RIFOXYD1_FULL_38_32]|nr:MAG: preprotein translocase subunit SecE [Candidatus Shapirobacteria bacterium RIFOXYA1_FULL_39_17]OGL58352.1 MAG: preprotein translocase subunit SecE [Candidatus Shapirobacteria bacterium RIFOXYD1_FULL_38_32]HAP37841.1 preprotein translocase subunit SecE [Candidatus Shapirobacteria bacterium]HCU55204.1 preprotein translocase subunit SecE [Candidatus Shapirobacteria bacterium]
MHKILTYLSEVKTELKNISWPNKDTLIQLTVVVIFISVAISAILGGADYLLTRSFAFITSTKSNQVQQIIEPEPIQINPSIMPTIPLPTNVKK